MSDAFDSETTNVMSSALRRTLARLKMLNLVDGDADAASTKLSKLILDAATAGERDEEKLILFAIGRYSKDAKGAP